MWTEGTIRVRASVFHYWVKHYEEPSIYGYEDGRAFKITLRRNAETVFNFDRGLDVPHEGVKINDADLLFSRSFLLPGR